VSEPTRLGVILFAHGARDPNWAAPFERLRSILLAKAPHIAVEVAYLEHMTPDLTTAVGALADRGVERITLVPLFMGRGGHLQRDLPQLVAQAVSVHPGVLIRSTPAVGEVDDLLGAIAEWIVTEQIRTGAADLGTPAA